METAEEARQRRLDALRRLAEGQRETQAEAEGAGVQEQGAASSAAPPEPQEAHRPRRRRRRPLWAALIVALCLIVVGVVALRAVRSATAQPTKTNSSAPLEIELGNGLACASAFAWSPDKQKIAAVGYLGGCADPLPTEYAYAPGVVNIYDAHTGKLLDSFQPDSLIQKTQGVPTPGAVIPGFDAANTSSQVVQYDRVSWAPDGQRLALAFKAGIYTVLNGTGGRVVSGAQYIQGVEVANTDGSQPHVLLSSVNGSYYPISKWDSSDNTGTLVNTVVGSSQEPLGIPYARSYSWDASDALVANAPTLSSATAPSAAPLGPVGNPDGGASFTIWQPQDAVYNEKVFTIDHFATVNPGAYTLGQDILAWSPDGKYLVNLAGFQGRALPQGETPPTADGLATLGLASAPVLPVRDAALQSVLAGLMASPAPGGGGALVAWRPNGRELAVQDRPDVATDSHDTTVQIYDCASGKKLASLSPLVGILGAAGTDISSAALVWSPDGSRLLALNYVTNTITIWGPKQLPK